MRLRPTVERERLRRLVLELRNDGLSYNAIIGKIEAEHSVRLNKSHISGWVNEKHIPFGSVRKFSPTPCPELAYVIGVMKGDASMSVNRNHSYMIKLRVIDKEFAEEFSRCMSLVLRRDPPRVRWREKTRSWHTQLSSLLLQTFLKSPLEQLKPIIEHCRSCSSAFLRGFFDSEGWVYRLRLGVVNTNLQTLEYVLYLLERRFQLQVFGPRLKSKGGRIVKIKGKLYHANKDCYELIVGIPSLLEFQSSIGFTIHRKKQRLASAIAELG